MRQVRAGVFETNSSSTHSLTICTEEEFAKFKSGETFHNRYDHEFVSKDTVKIPEDFEEDGYESEEEWLRGQDLDTYQSWSESEYIESFERHFTTPSGDKMVAFGLYGTDN